MRNQDGRAPFLSNHNCKSIRAADRRSHAHFVPRIAQGALVAATLALVAGSVSAAETIWHIKVIHPEGRLIDVKALDKEGHIFDVKAFEEKGNRHLMDVKALVDGKRMPVKVLVSADKFAPVKTILDGGAVLDIKALTPDGQRLDIKGVARAGNIIHIKAIGPDGKHYGVKAISPSGHLYDVKGVKMLDERVELKLHGIDVAAHIKALPQAFDVGE